VGTLDDFAALDGFDPFAGDRREELSAGRVLVAEVDGRVAGYATFSRAGFIGRPFVHLLAVAPEYRRRGIARSLLRAVERSVGRGRLFASTEEGNAAMLALLAGDGWTPAGCVRGANECGAAECFFYRGVADAEPGAAPDRRGDMGFSDV
jgi:GNAT superfamily N-acetyltransferase